VKRRRAWGAEPDGEGGVHFRVYAPDRERVEVEIVSAGDAPPRVWPLKAELEAGAWSGTVPDLEVGARYRYRLAGEAEALPDPCSRYQPEGPLGPSEVIDPGAFAWSDEGYAGTPTRGRVLYELHVGTFTRQGTWDAARARLPELARLGVTVVELMPVGEFAGQRGWGYDGVCWFAPYHVYGRPDDMRRFVDDAHRLGVSVILDVVYNHMGVSGNVLPRFAAAYKDSRANEWGDGLNFDDGDERPARLLVTENVTYWVDEFHLDGFRFDATQSVFDDSPRHILADAATAARAAAPHKTIYLSAENEPQETKVVAAQEKGGYGFDALWNDDFHHSALVSLTGHREAYFTDHSGAAREFVACVRHGFLFQGQHYRWQKKARGTSTRGLPHSAFVVFIENHDQVANYGLGERTWTRCAPARLRALTALLLLGPSTPLLLQGQEWNATALFSFYVDHDADISNGVKKGRAAFLQQFQRYRGPGSRDRFPDPTELETFLQCRLDWSEREQPRHARALALHRDLLELRRTDPTIAREGQDGVQVDAATISGGAFVVRFFGVAPDGGEDRLLLVNLGADLEFDSLSEPLVAPPAGRSWHTAWSSDDPRYGGEGLRYSRFDDGFFFPSDGAVLLIPQPVPEAAP
jgi:maltooligosyltrehalose trehalohydrolase